MVTNLISPYSNNPVVNQFVITGNNRITFQSYKTLICQIKQNHRPTLAPNSWDISTTTSKYLYAFLRQNGYYVRNKKDLKKMIKDKRFRIAEIKNA